MKVSRENNSVLRTFMMKNVTVCFTADATDKAVKGKSDIQMHKAI